MLAQAPPESAVQGAVEHYMAQMEDAIAHGRLAPDWFDVDRVRSELTERLRSGEAPRSIARWLDLETGSAFLSFAPLGALRPRSPLPLPLRREHATQTQ